MIGRVTGQIAGSLFAVAVMGTLAGAQSVKPSAADKVTINGWALSMSNVAPGANQSIQIQINGWSSPAQRQHLIETFLAKKQEGLVRELEKQPEHATQILFDNGKNTIELENYSSEPVRLNNLVLEVRK